MDRCSDRALPGWYRWAREVCAAVDARDVRAPAFEPMPYPGKEASRG